MLEIKTPRKVKPVGAYDWPLLFLLIAAGDSVEVSDMDYPMSSAFNTWCYLMRDIGVRRRAWGKGMRVSLGTPREVRPRKQVEPYIKHRDRTPEMYLAKVKKGARLHTVPQEMRSALVKRTAVALNGLDLACIPVADRSLPLCRSAVYSNGEALRLVPMQWRTAEMCALALQTAPHMSYLVPGVHEHWSDILTTDVIKSTTGEKQ